MEGVNSAVTSAITIVFANLQIKYDANMQSLHLMIRNLSAGKQPISFAGKQLILPTGQQPTAPVYSPEIIKIVDKKWNQSDLSYFDLYLNEVEYGISDMVILGKDVYNWNMVLFI